MPVVDVLQLTRFQPHQELLNDGKLVEIQAGMDVIFVSHQWLSMQHPDPDNVQLQTLQHVLFRLAHGQVDVENDFELQIVFKERKLRSKNWWKTKMKTMYIWLDYMCMPQLTSVNPNKAVSGSSESCQPDRKLLISQCIESSGTQDHRARQCDDSKLLAKAVSSLPAYVEMSSIMLVLVPADEHHERKGEVVDWCSWRRRGWCRLEYIAATLCRKRLQVMVVKAPQQIPEFVPSFDSLLLPPGLGEFSCCAVKHDFGYGTVACDKIAVRGVLTQLIEANLTHLASQKRWFELRYYACMQV